jgi:hypothetical protein
MLSLKDLLVGILLPAVVAGILLLLSTRAPTRLARVLAAWSFGAGYLCAHVGIIGWPAWPSATVTPSARDYIAWAVELWMVCSLTALASASPQAAVPILRAVFSALLVGASLRTQIASSGALWPAIVAFALLLAAWASTDALVARSSGPAPLPALLVTMTCASIATLAGHGALAAQLAGGLCACIGASAVVAWLAPSFQLAAGGVGVILLVLGGVLISAVFFADLHWASASLVLASLAAPWLVARSPARGTWRAAIVRAVIAAVFGAAAIAVAALTTPSYGE